MKLLLTNPELDRQILEIKKKIRLHMNGVTADSMKQSGIQYKQNLGVALTDLKHIASQYGKSHDLAERLRLLNTRECLLLATLLEPAEHFSAEKAILWMKECTEFEFAEQISMNLISKSTDVKNISLLLIFQEEFQIKIAGYLSISRIWKEFNPEETNELIECALKDAEQDNFHLSRALSMAVSRICRKDKNTAEHILKTFENQFKNPEKTSFEKILDTIRQEMIFLGYLY